MSLDLLSQKTIMLHVYPSLMLLHVAQDFCSETLAMNRKHERVQTLQCEIQMRGAPVMEKYQYLTTPQGSELGFVYILLPVLCCSLVMPLGMNCLHPRQPLALIAAPVVHVRLARFIERHTAFCGTVKRRQQCRLNLQDVTA